MSRTPGDQVDRNSRQRKVKVFHMSVSNFRVAHVENGGVLHWTFSPVTSAIQRSSDISSIASERRRWSSTHGVAADFARRPSVLKAA